jgi:hypothetical protein
MDGRCTLLLEVVMLLHGFPEISGFADVRTMGYSWLPECMRFGMIGGSHVVDSRGVIVKPSMNTTLDKGTSGEGI